MGNLASSLQDCVELDDSVLSIRNHGSFSYTPKFILVKRQLYLLIDRSTLESGKFVISLKEQDCSELLDYKFVDGNGDNAAIVIKQVKNTPNYVLKFDPEMEDGVYRFSIRYDKRRVCTVYAYCEVGGAEEQQKGFVPPSPVEGCAPSDAGSSSESSQLVLHDPIPNFMQDGPRFRTHLANWESILFVFRTHLKTLHERSVKLKEHLHFAAKAFNGMAESFDDIYDALKDQPISSIYRHLILSSASTCTTQAKELMRKHTATQQILLPALQSYLNSIEVKAITATKRIYHDQAKEFYSYIGKHLSRLSDSRLLPRRIQFELQRFDYFHSLLNHALGTSGRDFCVMLSRFESYIESGENTKNMQLALQLRAHFSQFNKLKHQERIRLSRVSNYSDLSEFYHLASGTASGKPLKEGLLWSNKNNGWHKQWVVLQDSQLSEYSDWKTKAKVLSRPSINLTFACVKRSAKKPNGFDIITTAGEGRSFQAESEDEMKQWLQALQCAVGMMDVEDSDDNNDPLTIVRNADPSNLLCCDCRSDKSVDWVSLNLLCVVCINCSGVHRSLGSHLSRIRSLSLDSFSTPESIQLLKYVSNQNVNSLYEMDTVVPISVDASIGERTDFITAKYAKKKFVTTSGNVSRLQMFLVKAIHLESIYLLQKCIAEGVMLNQRSAPEGDTCESVFQYSLRHYEGTKDHPIFIITEFLLLNGLKVDEYEDPPDTRTKWSPGQLDYWKTKFQKHYGVFTPPKGKKLPDIPNRNAAPVKIMPPAVISGGNLDVSAGSSSTDTTLPSPLSIKTKHLKFPKARKNSPEN